MSCGKLLYHGGLYCFPYSTQLLPLCLQQYNNINIRALVFPHRYPQALLLFSSNCSDYFYISIAIALIDITLTSFLLNELYVCSSVCLCVCLCVFICVPVCECMYVLCSCVYVCVFMCVFVHSCVFMCLCIHVCSCACVSVCVCMYMLCSFVCVYMFMCVCVSIWRPEVNVRRLSPSLLTLLFETGLLLNLEFTNSATLAGP